MKFLRIGVLNPKVAALAYFYKKSAKWKYDKLSWCEIFLPTLEHVNFPPYKTTEYGMIGQLLSKWSVSAV